MNDISLLSWKHQHNMHRQLWYNSNVMLQYSNLNASSFGSINSISEVKLPAKQTLDMETVAVDCIALNY